MKITVVTPDLSHNCLGRAYLLAKILQRRFEVEIVGPTFSNGIWIPLSEDKSIKYNYVKIHKPPRSYGDLLKLFKIIDGDIIYASKPLFTSYGLGYLKKLSRKKPLVLDIDDWQMGFNIYKYNNMSSFSYIKGLFSSAIEFFKLGSFWSILILEKLSSLADEITVSNNFLKKKFGGHIIYHCKDTNFFDPQNFDRILIRKKYNLEEERKIILFFGTPKSYKGIEELIKSISMINDQNVTLMIVGIQNNKYCSKISDFAQKSLKKRYIELGLQKFSKVPEIISIADIIVIPQRRNIQTIGQIPSKLFDAMAMAKPIIATDVCDLPHILNGCGWIVEPGNIYQLADKIKYILDNPEKANNYGYKARQKCIKHYSYIAIEKKLAMIFNTI